MPVLVKYSVFVLSFPVMRLSGNRFTSIISSDSHVLVLYFIRGTENLETKSTYKYTYMYIDLQYIVHVKVGKCVYFAHTGFAYKI